MVAEMGLSASGEPENGTRSSGSSEFTWTADAKEKLDRLPAFVKPMVQGSVEAYARKNGFKDHHTASDGRFEERFAPTA